MRLFLWTLLLLPLGACAAARAPITPAAPGESFAVLYRVDLASTTLELPEWDPKAEEAAAAAEGAVQPLVRVSCTILRARSADVRAALGTPGERLFALSLERAERDRLLAWLSEAPEAELISAPELVLHDGQRGHLSVLNQVAYVAAFEVAQDAGIAVADPQVDVAQEGLVVATRPRLSSDGARVALEIELIDASLERPLRFEELRLPGGAAPVQVQRPSCLTQRLATRADLALGASLALGGQPAGAGDHVMIAFVDVEGP
jgi:hypothetical protein